eukprot:g52296.t1
MLLNKLISDNDSFYHSIHCWACSVNFLFCCQLPLVSSWLCQTLHRQLRTGLELLSADVDVTKDWSGVQQLGGTFTA